MNSGHILDKSFIYKYLRYWGMFSLRHFKYYTNNLILFISENLGKAEKYEEGDIQR